MQALAGRLAGARGELAEASGERGPGGRDMANIRLLIAEDEATVLELLVQLFAREKDIAVVARATDGEQAVALARQHKPTVILTDLRMPRMDGVTAVRQIKQELPACAAVVLTVFRDDEHLFSAIKAGATGYVLKDAQPQQVVEAVRAVAHGEGFLGPALAGKVMAEFARISHVRAAAKEVFAELTRREMEVLELLGQGLRNREIGERLFLTEKTVKNYVSSIFVKLQVNDRTEAALLAARHGLTDEA
jgi:two-component system, NarL family, response regulator DegU